jgi:hypothetical protein
MSLKGKVTRTPAEGRVYGYRTRAATQHCRTELLEVCCVRVRALIAAPQRACGSVLARYACACQRLCCDLVIVVICAVAVGGCSASCDWFG